MARYKEVARCEILGQSNIFNLRQVDVRKEYIKLFEDNGFTVAMNEDDPYVLTILEEVKDKGDE